MREFNIEGLCLPQKHYMVDISNNLKEIVKLIDKGKYFVINRPRQYGKTTTLNCLEQILNHEYIIISISFEGIGDKGFENEENFCLSFMRRVRNSLKLTDISNEYKEVWFNKDINDIEHLSDHIDEMCKDKKVILMVDEVDQASNNRVFLKFLSILRSKYLERGKGKDYTFQSVILAGVYDIKNIKIKMVNEGLYSPLTTEERRFNSPWNIAAEFNMDMSFSPKDIESMLNEYQNDTNISMDTRLISQKIYEYTGGYPFLVSYICKLVDEELGKDWMEEGIPKAVKITTTRKYTLSDDLVKNLEAYKELYKLLYDILIIGKHEIFNIDNPIIDFASMFGYIKKENNDRAIISNKIFEIRLSNYFISKDSASVSFKDRIRSSIYEDIVKNDSFDMELCLCRFRDHFREIYSEKDISFLEKYGRLFFLTYLKPLINGLGFYHIESQLTDDRRMDLVVDFRNEQFIIELKIWDGESKKKKAYEQLLGYMNKKNADKGYLLIFDFRKRKKEQVSEWIQIGDKKIFSVLV